LLHIFRGNAVDAHGDESVFIGMIAGLLQEADHFRRDAVNAEGNKLVGVIGG